MSIQSHAGRVRIGEHVVELRAPRLSDAASWRRTHLEHERRLRPAFGSPRTDWDAEHSTAAWAEHWRRSRTDPDVRITRVLTVEDGATDRVVGGQTFAGRDPRTGHAEASTWIAGLPNSNRVAVWMSAANILDMFVAHPDLRFVVTPQTLANKPAVALATAVGFTHLQTLRALREFDGEPTDHSVYILHNTEESRRNLADVIASIDAEPVPARRGPAPSPDALLGLARAGARRLRARTGPAAPHSAHLPVAGTEGGRAVAFQPNHHGRYDVDVDGASIGEVQIHVDGGSSTTEIIDRLRPDAPADAAATALIAAARALARAQHTRRAGIALADRHAAATPALTELGYFSEGATSPTLGDEATPRETWTRLA